MNLSEKLILFGLNEKEANFYLAALELSQASMTEIAEKARLNRTTGYLIAESLREKGLMRVIIKRRKKLYIPSDPEELSRLIEQKSRLLEYILPHLKGLGNLPGKKPNISFYEGINGMIKVFLDNLTARGEILSIAGEKTFNSFVLNKLPNYIEQRVSKKILLKLIAPDIEIMRQWKTNDQQQLRITRLVAKEKFPLKINIDVYNNKVALSSPDEMIGLIIESRDIADSLRVIFNLLWENIKS